MFSLDQRLYDLPRKVRVARRRELRANLLEAAQDVGAAAALRDLGDGSALAAEYLEAELGRGPRASWSAAGVFLFTTVLLLNSVLFDAADAFGDGILAGDPDAAGTFTWAGIGLLPTTVTYTVSGGEHTFVGGAFTRHRHHPGRPSPAIPPGLASAPDHPGPGAREGPAHDPRKPWTNPAALSARGRCRGPGGPDIGLSSGARNASLLGPGLTPGGPRRGGPVPATSSGSRRR